MRRIPQVVLLERGPRQTTCSPVARYVDGQDARIVCDDAECVVAQSDTSRTTRRTADIVRHIIVVIIAMTFCAGSPTAQSRSRSNVFGRYQQVNWQERDGLPQNTVLAIATTRDGYVWMGTYEGAARFDGVRFTLFNPSNTTGIGNSQVTSLLERRDGDLWLGTYGGGVSRLSSGRFTQYATRDGLSSDFATCLFEDHAGTLWIGTDGGGVSAFSRGRFTPYTIAQGLPSNLVRAIISDGSGGLLVGTNRGMARIADGRVRAYEGRADVAHADISALARSSDGSLWAATMRGGLYRIDGHAVIAGQLGIGVRTVEHHRNNVAVKLELRGSHALTRFAIKHQSDF
jgi:ligand-binding sensor domain-containing protein